jgi:VWFA-related protein
VEWLQDCTNDPDALTRAFHKLQTGEEKKGRMLDAVDQAIERLGKLSNVRRVLLLISESRDRGSETSLETVAVDAQKAGVTVYAATYSAFGTGFTAKPSEYSPPPPPSDPPLSNQEPETLPDRDTVPISPPARRVDLIGAIGEFSRIGKVKATEALATATGGTQFPFTRQKGLEDAIEKLGSELETQYVLSFAPETPAPGYHHVEVRLSGKGKYRIRTRPGYWAVQVSR